MADPSIDPVDPSIDPTSDGYYPTMPDTDGNNINMPTSMEHVLADAFFWWKATNQIDHRGDKAFEIFRLNADATVKQFQEQNVLKDYEAMRGAPAPTFAMVLTWSNHTQHQMYRAIIHYGIQNTQDDAKVQIKTMVDYWHHGYHLQDPHDFTGPLNTDQWAAAKELTDRWVTSQHDLWKLATSGVPIGTDEWHELLGTSWLPEQKALYEGMEAQKWEMCSAGQIVFCEFFMVQLMLITQCERQVAVWMVANPPWIPRVFQEEVGGGEIEGGEQEGDYERRNTAIDEALSSMTQGSSRGCPQGMFRCKMDRLLAFYLDLCSYTTLDGRRNRCTDLFLLGKPSKGGLMMPPGATPLSFEEYMMPRPEQYDIRADVMTMKNTGKWEPYMEMGGVDYAHLVQTLTSDFAQDAKTNPDQYPKHDVEPAHPACCDDPDRTSATCPGIKQCPVPMDCDAHPDDPECKGNKAPNPAWVILAGLCILIFLGYIAYADQIPTGEKKT